MKKLLSALLACSLSFMLLGFKGCCKQNAATGAPKKISKKAASKTKTAPHTKVAYNAQQSSGFPDEEALTQFAYLDEDQRIEGFDTDLSAANNAVDSLSPEEQVALNKEINDLVSLWSTDANEMNSMAVDFKTLYLDSVPTPIDTEDTQSSLVVASAELPSTDEVNAQPSILTALDQAHEINREIEEDTKSIVPEELTA